MTTIVLATGLVLVALLLASEHVAKRALASLNTTDKARLVDVAASTPGFYSLFAFLIGAAWLAAVLFRPALAASSGLVALALSGALYSVVLLATFRRYKHGGLPPAFLQQFAVSRVLQLLAFVALICGVIISLRQAYAAT